MFGKLIEKLKENPKRIVFTEGTDARILEASARLLSSNFLTPILVGNEEEVKEAQSDSLYNDFEIPEEQTPDFLEGEKVEKVEAELPLVAAATLTPAAEEEKKD